MIRFRWRRGAPSGDSAAEPGAAPQGSPDSPSSIRGERAAPIVSGARSLQSRMSSLLAAGLMTSVGAAMLAWYYAEALSHPAATPARAHAPVLESAGEGMTLPPFGPLAAPAGTRPLPGASRAPSVPALAVLAPAAAQSAAALPASSLLEPSLPRTPGERPPVYGTPALSAHQLALERRLSGAVYAQAPQGSSSAAAAGDASAGVMPGNGEERASSAGPQGDALAALLRPTVLAATRAQILPTQHLLLAKGTFIDCTLETAIDSTLPGMTTCVTATDTFSADGTVVLLERGTKLIGETRGGVRQGQARVFVLWTEARTPAGVVVRLDSPGTDALGRSGLQGRVNRHFWQRFGAAALVSTIEGVVQSQAQSSSRGGTVVLDPTASEDVLTGILRSTVNIAPTIRVRNGARIQVLVARDVDFRPVYELEPR
ncbi:MAG: type IV secretion system protein VirB10 [Steroidobacteraceae bacterium]